MSTILLVEDNPNQSDLYAEELAEGGHDVLLASTGPQALAHARSAELDLVILDLNIVGMDGLQVLERLLEDHPLLPVILHSAYDYTERFITWCAEDYVVKSSDLSGLKRSVSEVLSRGVPVATPNSIP